MPCLALDTAGPYCSVAVAGDDGPVAVASERIERGHAERLMPMIDDVLTRSAARYHDIDRIGVTTGPGSFTGVRIGISVARGLALALEVEAFGVGVLDVMTKQAIRLTGVSPPMILVAALPAVRGEIFLQASRVVTDSDAAPDTLWAAVRTDAEGARRWIDDQSGPIGLIGSGAPAIRRDHLMLPGPAPALDHADIALLADMVRRGSGASPPRPLYLRAPDARTQTGMAVEHA